MRWRGWALVLLGWLLTLSAQANPVQGAHIEVELAAETASVQAGQPFLVGLHFRPEAHWHTYWKNPGDSGMPPSVNWQLPPGAQVGDLLWPRPQRIRVAHLMNYGYDGEVLLLAEITPPADFSEPRFELSAKVNWLVCKESCVPGDAELRLSLPVSADAPQLNPQWQDAFAQSRALLPLAAQGWATAFAFDDSHLSIELNSPQPLFAQAEAAYFFPAGADLIAYPAAQQAGWDAQRLGLKIPRSEYLQTAPQSLSGVLALYGKQGAQFFQLDIAAAAPNLEGLSLAPQPDRLSHGGGSEGALFFLGILGLALLGGLLLNLMPCVFPVLSLKALSLVQSRLLSQRAQRLHGLAYSLGVLLSFLLIAAALLLLQAGGAAVGWGFQLQTPGFVGLLAYVIFLLALSLSGWLTLGTRLMGVGDSLTRHEGYPGSFFTGVLAVLVASPCTAPFMGTALGYAITQPPLLALSVFAALGIGMALPFLLLAFFPVLLRFLPRPGAWMDSFKQFMAFPLYATVVWLVWVLGGQSGVNGMGLLLFGLLLLSLAIWLWQRQAARVLNRALAFVALSAALGLLASPQLNAPPLASAQAAAQHEQAYSAERLAALRAEQRPVFVNMTADWCITCLVNEQVALSSEPVQNAFRERGIVYLKGDWTRYNPEITKILAAFGRNGVPLYLYYPPGGEAKVLPQLLTPDLVLDAL